MSETLKSHLKKVEAQRNLAEIDHATTGIISLQRVLNYILEREGDGGEECELCDNGFLKSGLYYASGIIAEYIDEKMTGIAACLPKPTLWPPEAVQ